MTLDQAIDPRARRKARLLVGAVFMLQSALVVFPSQYGLVARALWPFSTGHMFNFSTHGTSGRPDVVEYYQVVLVNGSEERLLKLSEIIHPHAAVSSTAMRYRLRDGSWTARMDVGLAKAVQRHRCARHLPATGFVIYAVDWDSNEVLRGRVQPESRRLLKSFTLPSCE
jgi:hypothetical protein